jgi:hypothetical protein
MRRCSGGFLERRESGSCWDACGCFLALTARGPNSWRSRISWRCGYSIPGRRHGRQDRVAAALFPFFRCRDFFLTMRRAPLLTLWGNIRSAAARADRCKVLRVLLFGEQVRCEEPRFIFFRTCVFREEKQLVSGGLARLCVRYGWRKRAQCDRRRAGRYGARTEVTCQRAVPKSAAGAAGCVIETLVYYKFQPLSRPKSGPTFGFRVRGSGFSGDGEAGRPGGPADGKSVSDQLPMISDTESGGRKESPGNRPVCSLEFFPQHVNHDGREPLWSEAIPARRDRPIRA